jgi:thiamine pyrophosphokinase
MKKIQDLRPGVPVILADGLFPKSRRVLSFLDEASMIICCDGATVKLLKYGLKPDSIVGDMDSLPQEYQRQFEDIIVGSEDQETNDFTKAVNAIIALGLEQVVVLGATGQREDHTLGNIGLLVEHGQKLQIQILSDFGVFTPVYGSTVMLSYPAQQVSIFSIIGNPAITSQGLKYPLCNMQLENWWCGTLNEAQSTEFSLEFEKGGLVVFRNF